MNFMKFSGLLSLALVASVASAQAPQWRLSSGAASFWLDEHELGLMRIQVRNQQETRPGITWQERNLGLMVLPRQSSLKFLTGRQKFDRFDSGTIQLSGGFDLVIGKRVVSFQNPIVTPMGEAASSRYRIVGGIAAESGDAIELEVRDTMVFFDPQRQMLRLAGADLFLPASSAQLLGLPQRDRWIGGFWLEGTAEQTDGPRWDPHVPTEADLSRSTARDIGLCRLFGLDSRGREGTYPNGISGFAVGTTSINLGSINIPWQTPGTSLGFNMGTDHPVIVQNMYRLANGRFEQIGEAWLKHGWLATNSTECPTTCTAAANGQLLGPGCTDTYSSGNNSDRTYLGPRNEVNPLTGVWTAEGSFFAQGVNDRIRRINGSSRITNGSTMANAGNTASVTYTPSQNRIAVTDADMLVPNSVFVIEAYYITRNDINKYNQIGHRRGTATWNASQTRWEFTLEGATSSSFTMGPAINSWGDSRSFFAPRTEGDAIVAVKVNPQSGGWFEYDYAVYVHDLDRELDQFIIPVPDSVNVRNITYRDSDRNAANQWTTSRSAGNIRWAAQIGTNRNTLSYGRVFNFRFEAQQAPTSSFAMATMSKPGMNPFITAGITGPGASDQNFAGDLTLQGRSGSAPVTISVRLTPVAGGAPVEVTGVAVNPQTGEFSFATQLRGEYLASVDGNPFLRASVPGSIFIGPTGYATLGATLIAGDVNNDNIIDGNDVNSVLAEFGNEGTNIADVNGDEIVDGNDINVILSHFGTEGDD